ncbi:hypothetical protein MNBD_ACTINO02-2019, partial [hydrothermal vent metagenome]
ALGRGLRDLGHDVNLGKGIDAAMAALSDAPNL